MTRTAFSWLRLRQFRSSTDTKTVFSFFLPTAHFGFDKPVLAIPNLAHLFLRKDRQKANKLNFHRTQIGVLCTLFARVLDAPKRAPQAYGIFFVCLIININLHAQIKSPTSPTFNNGFNQQTISSSNYNNQNNTNTNSTNNINTSTNNNTTAFKTSYIAPQANQAQNNQTIKMLDFYKQADIKDDAYIKKQLWELKLRFGKFVNPNTELYKKYQPLYESAFDSINQMLTGATQLNLKKAVFLVENVLYENKLKYADFCKQVDNKVYIINQIIKKEKLSTQNNVALNYAIQQLYLKSINYTDEKGTPKIHTRFTYDFNDPMGNINYKNQFVTKFLKTGKGQCHSMPLLYLILANEIGAKANLAYSPNHSYIAFPDNENNYYNFECTSGGFTSYSFIMSSGHIKKEAIKSGIYTVPTTLKESVANQLNDLAIQQLLFFKAADDYQLKCAKQTLVYFPTDIMALNTVSNYQTAKTEATYCYAGYPFIKDIKNNPELVKEFDNRANIYDYIDNLGFSQMTDKEYTTWLKSADFTKAKQESEEIKKQILIKAKLQN